MSAKEETQAVDAQSAAAKQSQPSVRKNGKNWHDSRKPFRKAGAGQLSYDQRRERRKAIDVTKALEKEMKEEKEATRQKWIANIKAKREAKAEKERYEKMAEKMHQRRVDRIKRREKRNKMLNS